MSVFYMKQVRDLAATVVDEAHKQHIDLDQEEEERWLIEYLQSEGCEIRGDHSA